MFKPRPCGCKGIRTCLLCELELNIQRTKDDKDNFALSQLDLTRCYEYCHLCGDKAWVGTDVGERHPNHQGESLDYPGVFVGVDFLTPKEEELIVQGCDSMEWDKSQSGRRKQNYGPKTNFKKKKINGNKFEGFPKFSEFAQKKLKTIELLGDFQTIEQCAIEYRPETGACIDPHIDDCWIWGERVVSVNLLSDSFLTMKKYNGFEKYNLKYHYDRCKSPESNVGESPIVRIPMPARSILILYGAARYEWEHCILRRDITDRRICMAYREFTPEYVKGGEQFEAIGKFVVGKAQQFFE